MNTVEILLDNGHVMIINESDYDPKTHVLLRPKVVEVVGVGGSGKYNMEQLESMTYRELQQELHKYDHLSARGSRDLLIERLLSTN